MAAAGGAGDAELQGGGLPGALHRPQDRQERKILGPVRGPTLGLHTRAAQCSGAPLSQGTARFERP